MVDKEMKKWDGDSKNAPAEFDSEESRKQARALAREEAKQEILEKHKEEDPEGYVPPDRAQPTQPHTALGAHNGSEPGLGRPQGLPQRQPVSTDSRRAPAYHQPALGRRQLVQL